MENVFEPEGWDGWGEIPDGWANRARRLVREPGQSLTMSLYELAPAETQCPYHFHHGADELLLVLSGTPTVRTPGGEQVLRAGDVVHFPRGPAGAHHAWNASGEPARYVVAASSTSPEVVEYPDSGKVAAMARTGPLWTMHRQADAVDYFEGEVPHT